MDEKNVVALYLRVSSEQQVHGFSLNAQKEALLDYCRKARANVFKIYVDAGRSGKSISGRPALCELLEDAKKGCFQQVVCLRLNRLSRNLPDLLAVVELLDKHGITLHSLTEQFETGTPIGKFTLQMMGATAQLEREQISQNVQLSVQKRNQLGKWNSGNQVLGYRWISHPIDPKQSHLEIVLNEARLVRSIFEMYADGFGLKAIANRLNQEGHRTKRNSSFSNVSVRGLLTNVNYIGKITFRDTSSPDGKTTIDGEHEPIVSIYLWEQVQARLAQRSRPPAKTTDRFFPLSGLIKCPDCGTSMIPTHVRRYRKDRSIRLSYYYICNRYNTHGRSMCKPNHVPAEVVEKWVIEQLQLLLTQPLIADQLVNEINRKSEETLKPLQHRLKRIDTQLNSLKNQRLRCYELFEDEHIDSQRLKERLEEIRYQSETLQDEKSKLEQQAADFPDRSLSAASIRRAMNNFLSVLQKAKPEQQKTLFRSLIDKIILPPDRDVTKSIIHGKALLENLKIMSLKNERVE